MKKRIIKMGILFTIIITSIICKTAYEQLYRSALYATQKLESSQMLIPLEEASRGDILDRTGNTLLDNSPRPALIIVPKLVQQPKSLFLQLQQLAPELEITEEMLIPKVQDGQLIFPPTIIKYLPSQQVVSTLSLIDEPAMTIMDYKPRYGDNVHAVHLIGHLNNQKQGAKGLEKKYDAQLSGNKAASALLPLTDARGNILSGVGFRVIQRDVIDEKTNLWLTLDYEIQILLEETLAQHHVSKGAAVILDIATGNILAAASLPSFDPNQLNLTSEYPDNQLERVMGNDYTYYPGSIFKLTTALIALEKQVATTETRFLCDNTTPYTKCPREHGDIDFAAALKVSCNNFFIMLGQKIGRDTLEYYLIEQLGFMLEPNKQLDSFAARANGIIGQEIFKVSPLEMANFMMTIANQGAHMELTDPWATRLVLGTGDNINQLLNVPPSSPINQIFQPSTVKQLQSMIATISLEQDLLTYAGKTGTPEVYIDQQKGYQAWYIGYTPIENPIYAIAIVVEELQGQSFIELSGSKTALPIFKDLITKLPK